MITSEAVRSMNAKHVCGFDGNTCVNLDVGCVPLTLEEFLIQAARSLNGNRKIVNEGGSAKPGLVWSDITAERADFTIHK